MRRWALLMVLLVGAWPLEGQLISPDKLARPHAELEGMGNCTKCHTPGAQVDDGKCLDCHDKLAARIQAEKGYHVHFAGQRCSGCHSDHRGVEYGMIRWDTEAFDHDSTGYVLEGGHARIRCDQCHKTRSFLGLETDCLSCHEDTHRGQLATDCLTCHAYEAWKPVPFDHGRSRFRLQGRHAEVACEKCHIDGRYREIPFAECRDCHADAHRGQFAADCGGCHGESGWQPVVFDHDGSRFQLYGKHAEVACDRCHLLEPADEGAPFRRYRPLAFARCSDCHRDPHQPSLGTDCERCHAVAGWKGTRETFDHEPTRFPLRGKHAEVACERCHTEGRFRGLEFGACRDCHADAHQDQLAADCGGCHGESGWRLAVFDHDGSRFRLDGKHVEVRCEQCHPLEMEEAGAAFRRYRPLGMACWDCHADPHQGQFATDCGGCHRTSGWKPAVFDHGGSRFGLDGKHVEVRCEQCHPLEMREAGGEGFRRYRPLDADCAACHQGGDE